MIAASTPPPRRSTIPSHAARSTTNAGLPTALMINSWFDSVSIWVSAAASVGMGIETRPQGSRAVGLVNVRRATIATRNVPPPAGIGTSIHRSP